MLLNNLVRLSLLATVMLVISLPVFYGGGNIQQGTIVTLTVYIFVLLGLSYVGMGDVNDIKTLILLMTMIWVVIRGAWLGFFPDEINYQYMVPIENSDLSAVFVVLTIFTILLFLGMKLGSIVQIKPGILIKGFIFTVPRKAYAVLFFIIALIVNFIFLKIGGGYTKTGLMFTVVKMIFSFDTIIYILLSAFLYKYECLDKKKKYLLWLLLIALVLLKVVGGSKGAIYYIVTSGLFTLIALHGNFYIKKKYSLMGFLLFSVAVLLYVSGDIYRGIIQSNIGFVLDLNVVQIFLKQLVSETTHIQEWISHISRRLSMLDYLNVLIMHNPVNDYLGVGYMMKVIWNIFIPFSSFEFIDAKILPASLFKTAYGFKTYESVFVDHHSDMLPLFGIALVQYKGAAPLVIFIIGFIISYGYKWLSVLPINSSILYKALYLYFVSDIMYGMGLASMVNQLLFFTIPTILLFFFVQQVKFVK